MRRYQRAKTRAVIAMRRAPTCGECGKPGRHWVQPHLDEDRIPIMNWVARSTFPTRGFWICDKFYGQDGRRAGL